MMFLAYPFMAAASAIFTLLAMLLAPLTACFVDANGDLPRWLRWFQPADTKCWGDALFWQNQGAGLTTQERCAMWLRRNPAQGFDTLLRASCHPCDSSRIFGKPNIHDGAGGIGGAVLVLQSGYFWLNIILPLGFGRCAICYFGWRLLDASQNYGQFAFTPLRFNKFG